MKKGNTVIDRLVAISLALVMLVFSGCGGGGSGDSPAPPAKPVDIAITAGSAKAVVSWTAVAGATSYNIYYGTSAGVTTASGSKNVNAISPQTITGLTDGTPYYFVVTALNAAGESALSSEVSAIPLARPAGIVASGGDGQVTVSWSTVTSATAYNIYYDTAPGVTTVSGTKIANVITPQVVTGLTNGTPYFFVVTAVNAKAESSLSSEKSATPAAVPQPPGSPTGRVVTATGPGQMTVTWNPVPGATSYKVYYLQASSQPTNAAVLATTPATSATTTIDIGSLTSGATYYVLITALNAAGESGTQTKAQAVTIL